MANDIRLTGGWETLLDGPGRAALERDVLPRYLPAQRWFGGKARQIAATRFVDWAPLTAGATPTWLALLDVAFADGSADLYFLPMSVTPGQADAVPEELRFARLTGPGGAAVLHDALADPNVVRALASAVERGQRFALRGGNIRGSATGAFAELRGDPAGPLEPRLGPPTSSNSLVFFGDRLLLKVFRRLEEGINPDLEIGRYLTAQGTFSRTPKVAGALEYQGNDGGRFTLAIMQQAVPNAGDGWTHALGELRGYYERAAARGAAPDEAESPHAPRAEPDVPAEVAAVVGAYLGTARLLGRRTAEMHRALAADTADAAFAPEPLTADDMAGLAHGVRQQARAALAALDANRDKLPEAIAPDARRLAEEVPGLLEQLASAPPVPPGARKMRCHGDYHLGQVLWTGDDFVILDFEGEPTRTVQERRAKQSPLKDVAGMLRSLDYAAYAGLFAFTRDRPADFDRLEPWAALWQRWTSAAFLREYLAAVGARPLLPRGPGAVEALLRWFMLDKAFYELLYELNNRPDWVRIPLRGLLGLRLATAGGERALRAGTDR